MSKRTSALIVPMEASGTQHFIERTYREGGQYQWVRETFKNAEEAGATRIEFGVEWQAVSNLGVYRRMIADNGRGMTAEQLVEYFNTYGGGGKPIGGAHENFGVGSKTSLLPWNTYGMVVVSWVNDDASMIWVTLDPDCAEYGLKVELCKGQHGETTKETVYDPYDDPEHGCDWSQIKPAWIEDHGTVIVLLGDGPTCDTVEGDPNRTESDIKGISAYLNRRFWEIPEGVEVYVDELRTSERGDWPPNAEIAHGQPSKSGKDRRTNLRRILGARYYIEYPSETFQFGKLGDQGVVPLRDGTEIDWFLWEDARPKVQSYAAISGYIAALYCNELYDQTFHHSTYRSFGVIESKVRQNLWIIIRPPVDPDGKRGVYPKTDRNSLLLRGGPSAGTSLPINDWAGEFVDNMPDELIAALRGARKGDSGTLSDDEWRKRLAEKFGNRWRLSRQVAKRGGANGISGEPTRRSKRKSPGDSAERENGEPKHAAPRRKKAAIYGLFGGLTAADEEPNAGALPTYLAVGEGEGVGAGMLAAWAPKHPDHPAGAVLINVEHPVIRAVIGHWQLQFGDQYQDEIANEVIAVYGEVAVSKIAHSEHLKELLAAHTVETLLRSESALTMALLGLMAEEQLIATRVGGKFHKKRRAVVDRPKPRAIPR